MTNLDLWHMTGGDLTGDWLRRFCGGGSIDIMNIYDIYGRLRSLHWLAVGNLLDKWNVDKKA